MAKMKAVVLNEIKNPDSLKLLEIERPAAEKGRALVHLKASALNRRDLWITEGLYANIRVPVILGSDGAGVVAETGPDTDPKWEGAEVIINPAFDWGENPAAQGRKFHILGLPENGTQAEYIAVPETHLYPKPAHLSFEAAAALPLGGVTAFRALFTRGHLQAGETVLITGVGGGVAALALKFALAAGATVLVTSGSDGKLSLAMKAGAAGGANYRNDNWVEEIKALAGNAGISLILDSAGGEGFPHLLNLAAPGGRIVTYGATVLQDPQINLRRVFWKQLTIQGSTMGTAEDFGEMLRLVTARRIQPVIDQIYPLARFSEAYRKMRSGNHFGKIVLKHG